MARFPTPAGDFCPRPFRFAAARDDGICAAIRPKLKRSSSAQGP
jgi:hypothetical protein